MRFYTEKECEEWCKYQEVPLDDRQCPTSELAHQFKHRLRCEFPPSFTQMLWFAKCIESSLQPRDHCLLWVTRFDIFPSSENYHLYYRFRQSYGDLRLLHEAPGHLCLAYERPEVVTVVYLSMLFGWDVHLIPTVGYGRAFVSHDEWIEIGFGDESECDSTRKAFEHAKLKVSAFGAE
jgi:hypothetical protein